MVLSGLLDSTPRRRIATRQRARPPDRVHRTLACGPAPPRARILPAKGSTGAHDHVKVPTAVAYFGEHHSSTSFGEYRGREPSPFGQWCDKVRERFQPLLDVPHLHCFVRCPLGSHSISGRALGVGVRPGAPVEVVEPVEYDPVVALPVAVNGVPVAVLCVDEVKAPARQDQVSAPTAVEGVVAIVAL